MAAWLRVKHRGLLDVIFMNDGDYLSLGCTFLCFGMPWPNKAPPSFNNRLKVISKDSLDAVLSTLDEKESEDEKLEWLGTYFAEKSQASRTKFASMSLRMFQLYKRVLADYL